MSYKVIVQDASDPDKIVGDFLLSDKVYCKMTEFMRKLQSGEVSTSYPLTTPLHNIEFFDSNAVKSLDEYMSHIHSGCLSGPMTLADMTTFSERDVLSFPGINAKELENIKLAMFKSGGYQLKPVIW